MVNYRLTETMESRIHRKVYVRFGGEYPETRHRNMKMGVGYLAYVMNTVGNIFSGQVVGETAKTLSERFGKVLQKRQSITINRNDKSTSINTQMDSLIPPSKISSLATMFFRILQCPVAIATVNDSADAVTVTFYLSGFPLRSRENSSMMKIPMHKVVGSR